MTDKELRAGGLNSAQATQIAVSAEIIELFYLLITEKALLPNLDRRLTDNIRRYLLFRRYLRNLDLSIPAYKRMAEILLPAEDARRFNAIIKDSTEKEQILLGELTRDYEGQALIQLSAKNKKAYEKVILSTGILLYSLDKEIRAKASQLLQQWFFALIPDYVNEEKQGLAVDMLLKASVRFDIYYYYLKGSSRVPDYAVYLRKSFGYIDKILSGQRIPVEIRPCWFAMSRFLRNYMAANGWRRPPESEVEDYLQEKGFSREIIKEAINFTGHLDGIQEGLVLPDREDAEDEGSSDEDPSSPPASGGAAAGQGKGGGRK